MLDGNEGWVTLPAKLVSPHASMSLELWLTWKGPADSKWQRILEFGNATDYLFLTPQAGSSPQTLRFAIANGGAEKRARGPVPIPLDGKAHHVVVSYDPVLTGRAHLYLDGTHQASGPASIALADFQDEANWLGRSRYEALPFFKGNIHEFRIHSRALSQTNVQASHAAGAEDLPGPTITSFSGSPRTIRSGDESELGWTTSGAESLEILPGPLSAPGAEGSLTVRPTVTTTYTLRARNDDGLKQAFATVVVDDRPIIQSFTGDRARIPEGESVTLSWNVQFADSVSLAPDGAQGLAAQGSVTVEPLRTTYYTLSAGNARGLRTASLLVEVVPEQSLIISEFMAENVSVLADGDGNFEDWIEVQNLSPAALALNEYFLTDEPANPSKWRLPDLQLPSGGRMLFFASGRNVQDAGGFHHTNFKLQNAGEYLALSRNGRPVSEFHPSYPRQRADISFGMAQPMKGTALVPADAQARYHVPVSGQLRDTWTGQPGNEPFDDSTGASWSRGTQGLGFDLEASERIEVPPPYGYWTFDGDVADRSEFQHTTTNQGALFSDEVPPLIGEGQSLHFKGSQYVSALIDVPETRCTHAFWFKTTAATTGLFCVVDGDIGTGGHDRHIFLQAGIPRTRIHDTERLTGSKAGYNDGKWHHLAHVFGPNSGGQKLYLDGELIASGSKAASDFHWQKRINIGFSNDAAGSMHFAGWMDEVVIWDEELDATQIAALATGLARPGSTSGYMRFLQTSLEKELFRQGTSAYLRFPFEVELPFQADILRLNVRYDDGFIAWLNGQEVARDNFTGEPAWDSRALADRPPQEATRPTTFDLSAMKSLLRNGTNRLAIQILNEAPGNTDLLLAAELEQLSKSPNRYMLNPTPGQQNNVGVLGFVDTVKFGLEAGLFESSTEVPLSCSTPGATIIYTTDGSLPTRENGTQIHPAAEMLPPRGNVPIDATTTLRAAAFRAQWEPSRTRTRTFIFPNKVVRQAAVQPGITGWSDWGMDARVVDNPQPGYEVRTALYALPSVSIVTPIENLFGDNGIYTRSTSRGSAWERPASVELIFPDGRKGFQVDAGVQMHGNSSRNHGFTPKNPIRIEFKSKYGDSKLRYKLFDDSPRDSFDQFLLRPCSTDSWPVRPGNHVLGVQRWHPDHGTYMRDQYMRNLQRDMGYYAPHGRYVHLYLDGLYWGIYNIAERGGQHTNASYHGGDKEDWDIIKDFAELDAGSKDSWNQLISLANADLTNEANYQLIQGNKPDGSPDPALEDYLDVDNLIDYMIQHIHGGAEDWPDHNYWAARRKGPQSTGFHFITWDQEISNDSLQRTHTRVPNRFEDPISRQGPSSLYGKLMVNETFRWTFIDRVHRHMFNGGLLTPESNRARWARLQALLDKAIVAESARWGDPRRNPPYTREQDWLKEMAFMQDKDGYWDKIHPIVIQRFRNVGLYPDLEAPVLTQHGGKFEDGFTLAMTKPAATGAIHYTLDGSDPRQPGGTTNPAASAYTAPVPLSANLVTLKARVLDGGKWSALTQAQFHRKVVVDATASLAVTALNYNPYRPLPSELATDPTLSATDFEFIELTNTGTSEIELEGVRLAQGSPFDEFIFGQSKLAPEARILLVRNPAAFELRYGTGLPIAGTYTGKLSNNGESVRLLAADGSAIREFKYETSGAWPGRADGNGSVLEIIDPSKSTADPTNWRASHNFLGSPGKAPPAAPPTPPILINEVLTHTDLPQLDAVELHNPTTDPADISGWWLSDSSAHYAKFQIPDGSVIPAGGYLVFDESHVNPTPDTPGPNHFSFSSAKGDEVYLLAGNLASPKPTSFVDKAEFGAALNGVSFGLVPDGDPSGRHQPNQNPTLGGRNSEARFGPVTISEILYDPNVPHGQDPNDLEFVEIHNSSTRAVSLVNWRIRGGIDFDFPPGASLGPGQCKLLLSFNPSDPLNADKATLFEKTYGVKLTPDATGTFLGGYSGSLDDLGARITLQMADDPPAEAPALIPHPLHDEVRYHTAAPWPPARGTAKSLNRAEPARYGHASSSWILDDPSPGKHGTPVPDTDADGLPDAWEILHFGSTDPAPDADTDADGLPNLIEFALASNPSRAASVPVYATGLHADTEPYFTFTYTRRAGAAGLQFLLEVSDNLATWEDAAPFLETLAPITFNDDGTETLHLRDKRSVRDTTMRFLRLKVVAQ